MKTLIVTSLIFISNFIFITSASANWYKPACPGQARLQNKPGALNQYHCQVKRPARCPNGTSPRVVPTGADNCITIVQRQDRVSAPKCRLVVGQRQANWRVQVRPGADQCVHRTNSRKQPRPLKCAVGTGRLQQNAQGRRDMCVKPRNGQSQVRTKVTCPSGTVHKKVGRDTCNRETAPAWRRVR